MSDYVNHSSAVLQLIFASIVIISIPPIPFTQSVPSDARQGGRRRGRESFHQEIIYGPGSHPLFQAVAKREGGKKEMLKGAEAMEASLLSIIV